MSDFFHDKSGTAVIEYAFLISFIGIMLAGVLHVLGTNFVDIFSFISEQLTPIDVIENSKQLA